MKSVWNMVRKKYDNFSSFLKITVLYETVLVLSLVFVSLFATESFSSILKEKEIALGESQIKNLSDFMQEEYNRIYSLGNYIHNGDVAKIMAKIDNEEMQAYDYQNISSMQVFFSGISYSDINISDVILVSTRGTVYSYTRQASYEVNPSYQFLQEKYISSFEDSEDNIRIVYTDPSRYCIRDREPVVSFVGKIYDPSLLPQKIIVGYYIMNIPISSIQWAQNPESVMSQGGIYLVNKNDQILFTNDNTKLGQKFIGNLTTDRRTYVSSQNLGSSGMYIVYVLSENILFLQITDIRKQIIVVLIISIVITLLFSYIIYSVFQKKMSMLLKSMEELQHGNFNSILPVSSKDEIGKISMSFNEMCERLNIYVEQVYKSEIQRKNAEINALQTQIDPHFLYNTLESIKAEALVNKDEGVAEMIAILGNLFRWSSNTRNKAASLDEELEYVRNFLVLQSYRYNRQLEIRIDVSEEFLDYAVPKLILQPIVENVIKHALDSVERKKLVGIYTRKKNQNLELTVYDNGKGIPKERLQEICDKLQQTENQDEFESIGIQNVNQRLKLMFGQNYGLQIRSIENYGTAVKINVPAMSRREMNEFVQAIDCR